MISGTISKEQMHMKLQKKVGELVKLEGRMDKSFQNFIDSKNSENLYDINRRKKENLER